MSRVEVWAGRGTVSRVIQYDTIQHSGLTESYRPGVRRPQLDSLALNSAPFPTCENAD